MKKGILILLIFPLLFSCVSKQVYDELESKYNSLRNNNSSLFDENQTLINKKKELNTEMLLLKEEVDRLVIEKGMLNDEIDRLDAKKSKLQEEYAELTKMSSEQLSEKERANRQLLVQLQEKESKLADESLRLEKLQKELKQRSERVNQLEDMMAKKEAAMRALKDAVSTALMGFEGRGLTVEHKNGKVYVSMENKLLFDSGSWAVGSEGQRAVNNLAGVLRKNPDINVLIEGHTDNVPYAAKGDILDNWDLSTKRATAIVRLLVQDKVDPKQITAAGRSEYLPVSSNMTASGKAKNRRIEIILSPNLDAINALLDE
ncbi:MAG: OmpA family protein [Flavobacteriaceae bacterium]|nr:OmpA family protein [Flavobacteriaceae bacterium]